MHQIKIIIYSFKLGMANGDMGDSQFLIEMSPASVNVNLYIKI
jgi:hypothetical protein